MNRTIARACLCALLTGGLGGCQGDAELVAAIHMPAPFPPSGPSGEGDGSQVFVPAPPQLRRLTRTQYANAVTDLFGPSVTLMTALEQDETTTVFLSVGASSVGTSPLGVEQYHDAAMDLAAQVVGTPSLVSSYGGCGLESLDAGCATRFVGAVGERLFRRPLQESERAKYQAILDAGGGVPNAEALTFALAALLQSPNFLYVAATGSPAADGSLRYTSEEMATRLALFIWDSFPDRALLDAAAAGDLVTDEGLSREVDRMMASPRARRLPVQFFAEAWNVAKLSADDKNPAVYPQWNDAVADALRSEFERVIDDLVFEREGDLLDLLDGRETWVNGTLAPLYGLQTTGTDFVRVALGDERAGLLTSGAVIAANSPSDRSSPTHRGVFVLERVLCEHVPPPPVDVDDSLPATGMVGETLRERLEAHRSDPACAGCHGLFDPMGFTFETFDGIGGWRDDENGAPIDSTGAFEGKTYTRAADLATALRADPRAARCMVQQLYEYATGHHPTEDEAPAVSASLEAFQTSGRRFHALVKSIVLSRGFRELSPAAQP